MKSIVVLFCLIVFLLNQIPASRAQEKPNIVFMIADDWSAPHAGILGDQVVKTPNIDMLGKGGAVFQNAFCAAPSCSPSRASVLTGRFPHELEAGASLWGFLPKKFENYTDILSQAGYFTGLTGKGWGPGNYQAGGYAQNPAGPSFKDFAAFMSSRPEGKPFAYWFGSQNPHRPYEKGTGAASGLKPEQVEVPGWLPDVPEIRNDILDYYYEVQQFDAQIGEILNELRRAGEFDNTLIVVTSDNGMPFPRAKATLYDAGTKIPLIIYFPARIKGGTVIANLVSLTDIAPTLLEASGEQVPDGISGRSLWSLLTGQEQLKRDAVFFERERHANVRRNERGYPARAIRTKDFLYISNYDTSGWPAGDPELYHSVGEYGDVDDSPSKRFLLTHKNDPKYAPFFHRAFSKRPAEELYDLRRDPAQLKNVANLKRYQQDLIALKESLHDWQVLTDDPRVTDSLTVVFDGYPYFGPPVPGAPSTYQPPQVQR